MVRKIKSILKFLAWLEEERMKVAIHTCSPGPLM